MKPIVAVALAITLHFWPVVSADAAAAAEAPPSTLRPYTPPPEAKARDWPDDRLVAFMHELTDYVFEHHVVRDPARSVYGMTYEFFKDGRQTQDFPLDSMHDGAWLMDALVTARRADPAGDYLNRAQEYQVPFYLNILLNSDRLFPDYGKTDEDKRAPDKPIKGRIPLAWDDGQGWELTKPGKHCPADYNRTQGPNHLAQDVADALMNVWLSTRDPAIPQALMLLHRYRKEYSNTVPVIAFAAGITNDDADLIRIVSPPKFSPSTLPGYAGLYQQNGEPLAAYEDGLGWAYGQANALAARGRDDAHRMSDDYVLHCAARVLGHVQCMELFYADRPYPYGMHLFDIQGPPRFVQGAGRLDHTVGDGKLKLGARGIQIAWVAAGVLPELRRRPELWERYYREHHRGETLVRITDAPPETDGKRDAAYDASESIRSDHAKVTLLSDPKNLHLLVESAQPEVTLTIKHAGPVAGEAREGRITVNGRGKVNATNDKSEQLLCVSASTGGDRWTAELRLPYSVVPGQAQWINGVDNARYTVSVNGEPEVTLYFLSSPARVVHRLEAIALGTVETWHGIWKELGVIPSGYHAPTQRDHAWEWSDAGNYAHLIRTIALILLDRAGTTEWQRARELAPKDPTPASRLPASVLRAQVR